MFVDACSCLSLLLYRVIICSQLKRLFVLVVGVVACLSEERTVQLGHVLGCVANHHCPRVKRGFVCDVCA